jgi:hypothetical protein
MVKIINPMYGSDPIASAFSGIGKRLFAGPDAPSVEKMKWDREQKYRDEAIKAASDIAWQQANPGLHAQLQFEQGMTPDWYSTAGATTSALRDPRYAGDPTSAYLVGGGQGAASPHFMDIDDAEVFRNNNMTDARSGSNNAATNERLRLDHALALAQQQAQFGVTSAETFRDNNMDDATSRANNAATIAGAMDRQRQTPFAVLNEAGVADFANTGDVVGGDYSPVLNVSEFEATTRAPYVDDPEGLADLSDDSMLLMGVNRDAAGSAGALKNLNTPSGQYLITDESYAAGKDAQGRPLPAPTNRDTVGMLNATDAGGLTAAVATDLYSDNIAARKFKKLYDMAIPLTDNPNLFGAPGAFQSAAQDVVQSVGGMAEVVGARDTLGALITDMKGNPLGPDGAMALLPELYNSDLPRVETLWGLLVYQGAMALAGQQGRSVSDADVLQMKRILGDPHSIFASNLAMKAKLNIAMNVINAYAEVTDDVLANGITPGATTPDAGAPVRKQFMGADGQPHWFELLEGGGGWKPVVD